MTHDEFVAKLRSAATQLIEATDQTQSLLNIYTDIGASLALESEYADAGAAMVAVISGLGSGSDSNRAKINKIRR